MSNKLQGGIIVLKQQKYMLIKNVVNILLTLTIIFSPVITAVSENIVQYSHVIPECSFVSTGGPIRPYMLMATEYVSEDEVWFSGTAAESGPWVVKANSHGDILWQRSLPIRKGDRITVHCMSKTKNGLMLGIIDNETTLGCIVLLSEDGQFYQTSLGNAKIFSYSSGQFGILAQGVLYDEEKQTCAPQTTLINVNGEIVFQKSGDPYEIALDCGALTSSLCCASDYVPFIVEVRQSSNNFCPVSELVCLDFGGNEMWRVPLDQDFVVQAISAANGNVYLFGFSGMWNSDGLLTGQHAAIQCYSSEGVKSWSKIFDTPNIFQWGSARQEICVAMGQEENSWYAVVVNSDGVFQTAVTMEADAQYINKPYIVSEQKVIVLGMTNEKLFIKTFDY